MVSPPRLVCRCLGVSSLRIEQAARDGGLTRLSEIQAATDAGTACGTCHLEIGEILADLAGREVPAAARAANLSICHSETERRVEGSLQSAVVPQLPPGHTAELLRVSGLEAVIRLEGPDAAALQDGVAEKLRKLVCDDLDVRFS